MDKSRIKRRRKQGESSRVDRTIDPELESGVIYYYHSPCGDSRLSTSSDRQYTSVPCLLFLKLALHDLANRFRHHPREDHIVRRRLLSRPFPFKLIPALHCGLGSSFMTPLDSELLQQLGSEYLIAVEQVSIYIFFYGASSLTV